MAPTTRVSLFLLLPEIYAGMFEPENHFLQLLRENARLKFKSEKNVQGHTDQGKRAQKRKNSGSHSGFVGFFDFRVRKNAQSENLESLAPQGIHWKLNSLYEIPKKYHTGSSHTAARD